MPSTSVAPLLVSGLFLLACRGGGGSTDASSPDGAFADTDGGVSDAAGDAAISDGAISDACMGEPEPVNLVTHSVQVAYDLALPEATPAGLPFSPTLFGVFADATEVSVFSAYAFQRLDENGIEVDRAFYPDGIGGDPVFVPQVVAGSSGYGALVNTGGSGLRYCPFSQAGVLDLGLCSVRLDGGTPYMPRLMWDGSRYVVFHAVQGSVKAWTFDASGAALAEVDLWTADGSTTQTILGVGTEGGVYSLLSSGVHPGGTCRSLWRHTIDSTLAPSTHEAVDVLPEAAAFVDSFGMAVAAGHTAVIAGAACANPQTKICSAIGAEGSLLAAWTGATPGAMGRHLDLRARQLTWDGDKLMVLAGGESGLVLVGFDQSGNQILGTSVLPITGNTPGGSIVPFALVRAAPGDFVIAYLTMGPMGLEDRVARLVLTPD